jgi:hypothetical protein
VLGSIPSGTTIRLSERKSFFLIAGFKTKKVDFTLI